MSATQFFADREALLTTVRQRLQRLLPDRLVSWSEVNDKLNQRHLDTVYVVVHTYDNGCPEEYSQWDVGMFRQHDDATYVLASMTKNDKGEDDTYHIEVRRIY